MKKIVSLILVSLIVFSFAGCANNANGRENTNITSMTTSKKVEITRGDIDDDVYTNEILGLKFNLPSSWEYSTDKEISDLIGIASDMLGNEQFQTALDNNTAIYDMMAIDREKGANVIVGYENLAKTFNSTMSEEKYIEETKTIFKTYYGSTIRFSPTNTKITIGDTEFTKFICYITSSGVTMTQAFYIKKVDKYMSFIIATVTWGYSIEDIEEMFE